MATVTMDSTTRQALERLIAVALRDTGQSRRCADFLLAWHNAGENGGLDLTTLWGMDEELASACGVVFLWIASHRAYPEDLGYGDDLQRIWALWRSGE
ncbi:DUF7673 family protein [Halomonas sp. PA16-9]|jgi:hypothetical protein|uniref:DUF7673 family protein n=1 Tax=Halomonas sp. PA16-9 TaxID=2576841 RepID=UPI0012DA1370|nr:hypothetical protein FDY98_25070 [Halomonas sp. PA16-9]|tara:strand:+ start:2306 stop:2599 length:294 start_codon:yes stop_codon:yes gene_type:complete